mgnify:FL=1
MLDRIQVKQLTGALIVVTFLIIALGGVVRIYDAGESCPDWPTCFGTWGFDISEAEQAAWYEANPDEVDSRGAGHRYTTFQIFTEWAHRLLAGVVLGPLVLLNWLLVRREEELGSQAKLASSVAVALIVWQGAVGWLTVRMDNEHWSVALHLGSALAFMLSLIWLWLAAARDRGEQPEWATFDPVLAARWRNRLAWISAATLFTLFSGAFVSTTAGANTSCGVNGLSDSWPLCQGDFLPSIHDWVMQSQVIHRWLVVAVEVALLAASYIIWKEKEGGQCGSTLCKLIWGATGLYLVNIGIGASYILSWDMTDGYLEYLSLVHLMLASLTFLVLATAWLGSTIALNERGS